MKVKTSITLSEDVRRALDRLAHRYENRSELIELAVREFLARRARAERDRKDLEILEKHADRLNREAADVLEYQVEA